MTRIYPTRIHPTRLRMTRTHPTRMTRRGLIAGGALALVGLALLLGVLFPPNQPNAGASVAETESKAADGALLVSEFSDTSSTLWLVAATDPAERTAFLRVDHAPGWEIDGAVSPSGDQLAYVVLGPGRRDAETEASLFITKGLSLTSGDTAAPTLLAEGVDLRGGVTWTADGTALLVRRTKVEMDGRRSFAILEVHTADGRVTTQLQRDDVAALHIIGRPLDGPLYTALISRAGTRLLAVGDGKSTLLSSNITRGWTLSPGGTELAYTEQRGLAMQVHVLSLAEFEPAFPALRAATASGQALLDAALDEDSRSDVGTASPVWAPDGSLSVGTFEGPGAQSQVRAGAELSTASVGAAGGFALPLAWSPDGVHLAIRAFEGSGPGQTSDETAAIVGADGAIETVSGDHILVLGWWNGGR
jgi:hypothetical protein